MYPRKFAAHTYTLTHTHTHTYIYIYIYCDYNPVLEVAPQNQNRFLRKQCRPMPQYI